MNRIALCLAASALLITGAATAQTLRIGLAEDADVLDPTQARTFVGRIVFVALCDKLIDIDNDLKFVPQLATSWEFGADQKSVTFKLRQGVKFHDGEPFNAAAVKYNIERALTMPESRRKSEIAAVSGADVIDQYTVRLNLKTPFSPLMSQLTDRAGMMVSPKAAQAAGANFGLKPVCSGPYKFVERVAQDRIVLERFADYWDKGNYHFERVVYQPIPDTTVRLANLQGNNLDLIERLAPTDVDAVKKDRRLKLAEAVSLGYQGLTINIANSDKAKNPLGQDARLRRALELSIDREALNQVVFNGLYLPGNQAVPPGNPYYAKAFPMPKRDIAAAKKLLQEAGQPNLAIELMISTGTENQQVGQVIQSMAKDAGIQVKLTAIEFATALQKQTAGDFQAFAVGWSGRPDPDGNIHIHNHSTGALNDQKWSNKEFDRLVDAAREINDPAQRYKLYEQANAIMLKELPHIYLYHQKYFYAMASRLQNFVPSVDGLIRFAGAKFQ